MRTNYNTASDIRPVSMPSSNYGQFRIRSSSKDKFVVTTVGKQRAGREGQKEDDNAATPMNQFTERMKVSHKELKKILLHRRHQRQRSQDFSSNNNANTTNTIDRRFLQTLDSRHPHPKPHLHQNAPTINYDTSYQTSGNDDDQATKPRNKIVYDSVKTQESHMHRKHFIDMNSIDTTEDIRILDRITNMCDPFRIIRDCGDERRGLGRGRETECKGKSSSASKRSKLTDKINTLVFQMAGKSKGKGKSGGKMVMIRKNKFEPIGSGSSSKVEVDGGQNNSSKQSSQPRPNPNSSPKPCHRLPSPKATPKALPHPHTPSSPILLHPLLHSKPKHKIKINITQMKENRTKNDTMDKFWSGINESLILAAQEQYVSKDLNQLMFGNGEW